MNLCPFLEEQIRIQVKAIRLWISWMAGLVLGGVLVLVAAHYSNVGGPAGAEIAKIGGAFVGALAVLPYREIIPRKERLATYSFLLERLRHLDLLPDEDRKTLLSLVNDALKETLKK